MASTDPEPEPEDAITKDEIAAAAPAPPAAPDVGAQTQHILDAGRAVRGVGGVPGCVRGPRTEEDDNGPGEAGELLHGCALSGTLDNRGLT